MDLATALEEGDPELACDDDLIEDAAVFVRAYERHKLPVYRYLRARGLGEDDALELTAITFERVFARRRDFRPRDGGLGAWLLRIARNAAIDQQRRRRHEVQLPDDAGRSESAGVGTDPAERDRREVRDAVEALPADQRDAVWLRYAAGLTGREIGKVVGKSEAAVQKQLQRALATLREVLS